MTETEPSASTESETTDPAVQGKYLTELDPLTSSGGVDTGAADINGKGFARSVTLSANAAGPVSFAEYHLGRQWRTFSATVGLRDDSPTGGSLTFEIVVDGSKKYGNRIPLGKSQEVNVDVTHALRMKLTITYTGQDSGSYYYGSWGDAKLK
ncbi:NPCBM/NEW2 domain-containing protein [Streptomyces sp. NPDC054766]